MREVDLREIKRIIIKNIVLFLSIVLIALVIGILYTFVIIRPKYESTAKVVIEKNEASMVSFIENEEIYVSVAENLNLNTNKLRKNLNLSYEAGTKIINIRATDASSETAKDIANETAKVIVEKIKKTYELKNSKIIQKAVANNNKEKVDYMKNILIFVFVGISICVLYIFVELFKKSKLVGNKDILDKSYNVLGEIQFEDNMNNDKGSCSTYIKPGNESFKKIITNISLNPNNKDIKTLLITSTKKGEGKSFVSTNLALNYANIGKKVLLVECNIGIGKLHEVFEVSNKVGFAELMKNCVTQDIDENIVMQTVQQTKYSNLFVIPGGSSSVDDLYGLIMSSNLKGLVGILNKMYDIIIFDGMEAIETNETFVFSNCCDATVIITEYNKTKLDDIECVRNDVEKIGGKVVGIVVNKSQHKIEVIKNIMFYVKKLQKNK